VLLHPGRLSAAGVGSHYDLASASKRSIDYDMQLIAAVLAADDLSVTWLSGARTPYR
jgi:hypothetical protein